MTATISCGMSCEISGVVSAAEGACCGTGTIAGKGAGAGAGLAAVGFFTIRDLTPLKKAQIMAATPMARSIQSSAEPLGHSERARK